MARFSTPSAAHPRVRSSADASRIPRWVPVRRLGPRHAERVAEHLLALSPEDRTRRFGLPVSDERIRHYLDRIDFRDDLVFGIFDRRLRLVAMAHLAFGTQGRAGGSGEFGVSVLAAHRGQGLGTRLFDRAVTHARNRGVREMVINIARDNDAMVRIVRRAGATLEFDGPEVVARLPLAADTLGTQIDELIDRQAADWDYRLKLQAFRLDWPALWSAIGPVSPCSHGA